MKNMSFINELKRSFKDPFLYKEAERGERRPFTFLANLSLIMSLVFTIILSAIFVPKINMTVQNLVALVKDKYPADLVLTFKDGGAKTDIDRVFTMHLTDEEERAFSLQGVDTYDHMIMIDTSKNAEADLVEISKANAFVFVAKDGIVVNEINGTIRIEPIAKDWDITISETYVFSIADAILKNLKYILPFSVVLFFVGIFMGSFVSGLIFALITALFVWAMRRVRKNDVDYKNAVNVSVYAVSVPLVLNLVLFTTNGIILPVSVAVFLAFAMWGLNELRAKDTQDTVV